MLTGTAPTTLNAPRPPKESTFSFAAVNLHDRRGFYDCTFVGEGALVSDVRPLFRSHFVPSIPPQAAHPRPSVNREKIRDKRVMCAVQRKPKHRPTAGAETVRKERSAALSRRRPRAVQQRNRCGRKGRLTGAGKDKHNQDTTDSATSCNPPQTYLKATACRGRESMCEGACRIAQSKMGAQHNRGERRGTRRAERRGRQCTHAHAHAHTRTQTRTPARNWGRGGGGDGAPTRWW